MTIQRTTMDGHSLHEIWYVFDERGDGREDATWYVRSRQPGRCVVAVTSTRRRVEVRVDGTLLLDIYRQDLDRFVWIGEVTDGTALEDFGVDNDSSLSDAVDSGRFMWVNNPWYSIYSVTPTGYDLGENVYETLTDALEAAKRLCVNE